MANQYINNMTALWNVLGTTYSAIKMNVTNAASAAGSKLLDLQVGTVAKFTVDKDGNVVAAGTITSAGEVASGVSRPASNDGAALGTSAVSWSDLHLASGGVIQWNVTAVSDVTITHSPNLLAFAGASTGYSFDAVVMPTLSDGSPLGAPLKPWSDLYLAVGALVTFGNNTNDVVLSHSAGAVTVTTGDLRVTTAGTQPTSMVTVGGSQTLTSKTLTSPAVNSATINTPTITGTPTAGAATWTSLGIVTTCDINGGTIDGTPIGQTTPSAVKASALESQSGVFTGAVSANTVSAPTGSFSTSVFGGKVQATQFVEATGTNLTLGPTSTTGSIYFHPQGIGSSTGRVAIDSTGAISTAGQITAAGLSTVGGSNSVTTGTVDATTIVASSTIRPFNENATLGNPGLSLSSGWSNFYMSAASAIHFGATSSTSGGYHIEYTPDPGGNIALHRLTFSGATTFKSIETQGIETNGSTISTSFTAGTFVAGGASVSNGVQINASDIRTSRTGTAATSRIIFYNATVGAVGQISTSAAATAYTTTSDERIKENFRPFDSGAILDAINTYQFDWKQDGKSAYGVKAQECYEVFPDAIVVGSKAGPEAGDDFVPYSADYAKFVPLLLAEIKALRARVAALEGDK